MYQADFKIQPVKYFAFEVLPAYPQFLEKSERSIRYQLFFRSTKTVLFPGVTHNIYDIIIKTNWHDSIECVRKTIARELSNASDISQAEAMDIVDKELWKHIASFLNWQYNYKYPKDGFPARNIPFVNSPASMVGIKFLRRKMTNKKTLPGNSKNYIKSLYNPRSPDYLDFKIIQESLSGV